MAEGLISTKRWIIFAIVVTLDIAALVWSERHRVEVRVTPASLLYFIADSQWELSRLPMAATRLSDQEGIGLGSQMAGNTYFDLADMMAWVEIRAKAGFSIYAKDWS